MKILQIILIVVIFFFMIVVLCTGTETGFILEQKEIREETPVTCYAKEDIQRVEQFKCRVLLQALKIKTESECDCSEEIEDVENMYKEYIMRLEETCYYQYNSYLSWEY